MDGMEALVVDGGADMRNTKLDVLLAAWVLCHFLLQAVVVYMVFANE
jgi:hypothetical protein